MLWWSGGNLNPDTTYLEISAKRLAGVIYCRAVRRDGGDSAWEEGVGSPHLQLSMSFGKMEDEFTGYWIFL